MTALPQVLLVARLNAIEAVTNIVGTEIRAEIIPGREHYPALVMSVLSNRPANDADGGSNEYTMKVRVAALGLSQNGAAPYDATWALAMAVAGDTENESGPTGVNGWKDSNGNIWRLDEMLDESGQIENGTDHFWAFVVNMFFTVQWKYAP